MQEHSTSKPVIIEQQVLLDTAIQSLERASDDLTRAFFMEGIKYTKPQALDLANAIVHMGNAKAALNRKKKQTSKAKV